MKRAIIAGVVAAFFCSTSSSAAPAPAVKVAGQRMVVTWRTDRTLRSSEHYVIAFVSLRHVDGCDSGGERNRISQQRRKGRTVKVTLSTLSSWCKGSGYLLVDVDRGGRLRNLVTKRLRL